MAGTPDNTKPPQEWQVQSLFEHGPNSRRGGDGLRPVSEENEAPQESIILLVIIESEESRNKLALPERRILIKNEAPQDFINIVGY
jgi:hypothetical protein